MARNFTTERLAAVMLFVLLFVMAVRVPTDSDVWWHLRAGMYQLDHLTVLRADVFSHTQAGTPWLNVQWSAQIIIALCYRLLGGDLGLALYTALLAAGGMLFIYRASSGNTYVKALAMVLGAAAAAIFWSPRPQMFSFFFGAVVYWVLSSYKTQGKDRLWIIPSLMLLWGNMHGGFMIGFIFIGGFLAGEVLGRLFDPQAGNYIPWAGLRKLLLVTVVAAAALVVNPYGFDVYRLPFETVNIGVLQQYIQEWTSPDFHQRETLPFILLLLGTLGLVGLQRRERLGWTDFVLVAGTAYMALTAARNIAVFATVATPVFARHFDAFLAERGWQVRPRQQVSARAARLNLALLAALVLVAALIVLGTLAPVNVAEAQAEKLPVDAVAYINAQRPDGLMFNDYNWGGYLMFAAPDFPVYIDGRTDLYGDDFIVNDYVRVIYLQPGWREVLDEHDVSWVLVEANSFLAAALRDETDWSLRYEDAQAVLFTRNGGGG